jgi:uncharacterized membrane protein
MKIKKKYLSYIFLLAIFIASFTLFGLTGLLLFLGFFFTTFLPSYLIFKLIELDELERLLFSVFIGLIFVPLLVWYADRIIHSLRLSITITTIILYLIAFVGIYYKHNKKMK